MAPLDFHPNEVNQNFAFSFNFFNQDPDDDGPSRKELIRGLLKILARALIGALLLGGIYAGGLLLESYLAKEQIEAEPRPVPAPTN